MATNIDTYIHLYMHLYIHSCMINTYIHIHSCLCMYDDDGIHLSQMTMVAPWGQHSWFCCLFIHCFLFLASSMLLFLSLSLGPLWWHFSLQGSHLLPFPSFLCLFLSVLGPSCRHPYITVVGNQLIENL